MTDDWQAKHQRLRGEIREILGTPDAMTSLPKRGDRVRVTWAHQHASLKVGSEVVLSSHGYAVDPANELYRPTPPPDCVAFMYADGHRERGSHAVKVEILERAGDTFTLTCRKCGRSMTLEQGPLTRADTTIDECALCNDERTDPPQPITFRDDEGRERRLIVSSDLRDATPDDLSRAGYSPLKEAMRWYKRAQVYRREIRRMNAALRVANLVAREQAGRIAELLTPTKIKAMLAELEALRALERYCRGLEWNRPTALEPLLKAIDEAREKKETT